MELIVVVVISAGIAENSLNGVSRSLRGSQNVVLLQKTRNRSQHHMKPVGLPVLCQTVIKTAQ